MGDQKKDDKALPGGMTRHSGDESELPRHLKPGEAAPDIEKASGIHEAVLAGGEVPLSQGAAINPGVGTIPRSPGEWPSGPNPPENPTGAIAPPKSKDVITEIHQKVEGKIGPASVTSRDAAKDEAKDPEEVAKDKARAAGPQKDASKKDDSKR